MSIRCIKDDNIVANQAPIAVAGDNQNITIGYMVDFDGTYSSDSDGIIVSYKWKDGDTNLSTDDLFSVDTLTLGEHNITLTVTDDEGATGTDTVIINIEPEIVINQAPIANAGTEQSIPLGSSVTLDGSGSSDENEDNLTYTWSVISNNSSNVTISNNLTPNINPTFETNSTGVYEVELIINDGTINSEPSTVIITVTGLLPES